MQLTGPFRALEAQATDWRFLFRGPYPNTAEEIVLVLVEDGAELDYRSPIPRRHLAQVIERLSEARLIGLDIILDAHSFDREGDKLLRDTLERSGNVVAVSYMADGVEHGPHPYFREVLSEVGYADFATDAHAEIVRRGTLARDLGNTRALSLTGSLYAEHSGIDVSLLRSKAIGELLHGVDLEESLLINYAGPPNQNSRREGSTVPARFIVCPSHLVAAGVYPPAFFTDKIVFVGTGMSDAPDQFRTPFFASAYDYIRMHGVEVHAHFLQMLISGNLLNSWGMVWTLVFGLILAMFISLTVRTADVIKSAIATLIVIVFVWVTAFVVFSHHNLIIPLIFPTVTAAVTYGLATAYHALIEGRSRRQTRRLFEKYLSPELIEELLEDEANWELGGKFMRISVMFADLEGFTPMSEKLEPEELVSLMNFYLSEMSSIIIEGGGTIDKYEGDLIMALFGAPIPTEDHATQACRVALQMQKRMVDLRKGWKEQGFSELKVRIGVHSGIAVVGNMGSNLRFNYTAMGDTVNVASRLEGTNKEFGTYTIVSDTTKQMARLGEYHFRDLGGTEVKGRSEPVSIFELVPER